MRPPEIVIRLPLEGTPVVETTAWDEEEERLIDWLAAHPALYDLAERALAERDKAEASR